MPYTKEEARQAVRHHIHNVKDVGDLNFFFTLMILKEWANNPRYATYHGMKMDLQRDPKNSPLVQFVRRELCDRFTVADVYTAADAALTEFERRVMSKYEKKKIKENGDIPEYVQAIEAIENGFTAPLPEVEVKQ